MLLLWYASPDTVTPGTLMLYFSIGVHYGDMIVMSNMAVEVVVFVVFITLSGTLLICCPGGPTLIHYCVTGDAGLCINGSDTQANEYVLWYVG